MDALHAILICDDDDDTRAALRRALRGHHVTEAASPQEALAALRAARFDAVLSDFDYGAGEGDGLELLQNIRLQWPDTLRVLITGNADVSVAIRAVNGGAVDRYILKPWNSDTLRASIE
ncbi:MAG TPA: response regulator, partial [Kofleriaceae bacterium]|nr:response regulator [Kofleriaceae bacterium]